MRVLTKLEYRGLAWTYALVALPVGILALAFVHASLLQPIFALCVSTWPPVIATAIGSIPIIRYVRLTFEGESCFAKTFLCAVVFIRLLILYQPIPSEVFWTHAPRSSATNVVGTLASTATATIPDADTLARLNFFGWNEDGWIVSNRGRKLIVVPKSSYQIAFPSGIPMPVPAWSGDFVIHDGQVESLSPEQAQQDPRLKGVPLYPRALAMHLLEGYEVSTDAVDDPIDDLQTVPALIESGTSLYWQLPLHSKTTLASRGTYLLVNARNGSVYLPPDTP